jgi:hypothetical protein
VLSSGSRQCTQHSFTILFSLAITPFLGCGRTSTSILSLHPIFLDFHCMACASRISQSSFPVIPTTEKGHIWPRPPTVERTSIAESGCESEETRKIGSPSITGLHVAAAFSSAIRVCSVKNAVFIFLIVAQAESLIAFPFCVKTCKHLT